MDRNDIIEILDKKGYEPKKDLNISSRGTVYKYKVSNNQYERLYIVESNKEDDFWGMSEHTVQKLTETKENFFTILLSTKNCEAYFVNEQDIKNMYKGALKAKISTDQKGNFKFTRYDLPKINAIYVQNDTELSEFLIERF